MKWNKLQFKCIALFYFVFIASIINHNYSLKSNKCINKHWAISIYITYIAYTTGGLSQQAVRTELIWNKVGKKKNKLIELVATSILLN